MISVGTTPCKKSSWQWVAYEPGTLEQHLVLVPPFSVHASACWRGTFLQNQTKSVLLHIRRKFSAQLQNLQHQSHGSRAIPRALPHTPTNLRYKTRIQNSHLDDVVQGTSPGWAGPAVFAHVRAPKGAAAGWLRFRFLLRLKHRSVECITARSVAVGAMFICKVRPKHWERSKTPANCRSYRLRGINQSRRLRALLVILEQFQTHQFCGCTHVLTRVESAES